MAFEIIMNDMRSIAKSDPAIQIEPTTYCNISPKFVVTCTVKGYPCCSDFRCENNGMFVLGVGFFLQTNFYFLNSHFWRIFKKSFKIYCCPEPKFKNIFHLWSFVMVV